MKTTLSRSYAVDLLVRLRMLLTILVLGLTACYPVASGGGDDEAGDPVDQTPDGHDNPHAWPDCKVRLQTAIVELGFDEFVRETCVFAPTTPPQPDNQLGKCVWCGWPAKPFAKGLPQLGWDFLINTLGVGDVNPRNAHQYQLALDNGMSTDDMRSGLICNFAIWTTVALPTSHPMVPIATNMVWQVGHPYFGGRYNACGTPCSTYAPGELFDVETHGPDCRDHIVMADIKPVFTFFYASYLDAYDASLDAAMCLSNEGMYAMEDSALDVAALYERNGLTWLNIPEYPEVAETIYEALEPIDAFAEQLDWIFEWMEDGANYFPEDPEFDWSDWSHTGVCAFDTRISTGQTGTLNSTIVFTRAGCPKTHFPVYPPFDVKAMKERTGDFAGLEVAEVKGFCGLPSYDWTGLVDPENQSGSPLAQDPVMQLDPGLVPYERAYAVDFSQVTIDVLLRWASELTVTADSEGWMIEAATLAGEDVLASFGMESGDVLVMVDELDLRGTNPASEIEALARYVTDQFLGYGEVTLWIVRDEHLVLPTYALAVLPTSAAVPE